MERGSSVAAADGEQEQQQPQKDTMLQQQPQKDTMLQQLKNMGFPEDLSAAALSATASKSTSLAAEWILNHPPSPNHPSLPLPPTTTTTTSSGSRQHYSLDRYFSSSSSPTESNHHKRLKPTTSNSDPVLKEEEKKENKKEEKPPPLYERMRPQSIEEVVGQDHLLGPNSILRSSLSHNRLPSLILWGPPGTGKTSLAHAISASSSSSYHFLSLSAVTSGVKDVREALDEARRNKKKNKATVLFVDEVHRFNRSQLDSFLPSIEQGLIVFMGATTENPSFHLTTPLLSRCHVLALRPLDPTHVVTLLRRAISDPHRGLTPPISVDSQALDFLSVACDGDARVALNALDLAATIASHRASTTVVEDDVREALQRKHVAYDRAGDEHYNLISALHKSMRGGDADAALYWLARMLEGGEEPLYIARRLVRFAGEDVGLADPSAVVQAIACQKACQFLGLPECDVSLAQCVAYLALAPKSVAAYKAIKAAREAVRNSAGGNEGVPLHLRNAPTKLMKDFGYGKGYVYPPDHPDLPPQSFLPPSLVGRKFLDWLSPISNSRKQ